ncbi:MAG: host attachment protein [Pseudobdellovibrio sp.]
MKEWVIVASRAEAKIFKRDNVTQNLQWIKTLINKKGRRKEREFETDKPGVSYARFAAVGTPHNLEGRHSHAEIVSQHFANAIGNLLKTARDEKKFDKVTVFAGPNFLGKIRHETKDQIKFGDLFFVSKNIEKAKTELIMNYMN